MNLMRNLLKACAEAMNIKRSELFWLFKIMCVDTVPSIKDSLRKCNYFN